MICFTAIEPIRSFICIYSPSVQSKTSTFVSTHAKHESFTVVVVVLVSLGQQVLIDLYVVVPEIWKEGLSDPV